MKRPLFVMGITFTVVTWAAFWLDSAGALFVSAGLFLAGLLLALPRREKLRLPGIVCLTAAVALGCYSFYCLRRVDPFVRMGGKTIWVEGVLVEDAIYTGSASFTMIADFPDNPQLPQGQRVLLRAGNYMEYKLGDTVRCQIKASLPEDTSRARYYRSQGVVLVGNLLRDTTQSAPAEKYRPWRLWLWLRQGMENRLKNSLPDSSAQLVGIMAMGLSEDLDPDIYAAVSKSGTAHLLAVSGLHLSILTTFLMGLLRRLKLPRTLRYLLTIVLALGFSVLVGLSASIVRGFVMLTMMLLGRLLDRQGDPRNSLGLALLLICVVWPHWTLGRGLWLSAGSTLGILLYAGTLTSAFLDRFRIARGHRFYRPANAAFSAMAVSVGAYAFSLPILLVTSGWFPLMSPLSNLLILPFITPALLGGILCAMIGWGGLPMRVVAGITHFSVQMIVRVSRAIAALPFATLAADEGYLIILMAFMAVGVAVLIRCKAGRAFVGYAATLCVLCYCVGSLSLLHANRDKVELVTLEGCGAAFLLRDKQAVLLGTPDRYEINKVIRYLDFRGVRRISAIVDPGHGDQVSSALLRLAGDPGFDCMVATDDAYILSMLENALPDNQIFSAGYAHIWALDCALITPVGTKGDIRVRIGEDTVFKTSAEYAIVEGGQVREIRVWGDGYLTLPENRAPLAEPMGRYLFGETRLLFSTGKQ